jgi:pyrimidine-specific ribonucleoside hydrolase
MNKQIILSFILLFLGFQTYGHSGKAKYHVIVDTDGGIDDLRAICLLLASPDFEVIAITSTDGNIPPAETAAKINNLLVDFHHEGIPVGVGKKINIKYPEWSSTCLATKWGLDSNLADPLPATTLMKEAIQLEDEPVTLVCLGGLTNIAQILGHQGIEKNIESINWYLDNNYQFNLQVDPESYQQVIKSGIPLNRISGPKTGTVKFNDDLSSAIETLDTRYANKITEVSNGTFAQKIKEGKLGIWDDLVPFYLLYPSWFQSPGAENIHYFSTGKLDSLHLIYLDVLGDPYRNENKVFDPFPKNPELFGDDFSPHVEEIIQKHGHPEFRAAVITNELHGHLGIYSIIGAKMGIRAREYFNIGVDEMVVTTFTGKTPPLSCMNDGIQVSTGATLGHGLISISDSREKLPRATFRFKEDEVTLTLKEEVWDQIKHDIKNAIAAHGNLTANYWKEVRKLAINYWVNFDRYAIFTVS